MTGSSPPTDSGQLDLPGTPKEFLLPFRESLGVSKQTASLIALAALAAITVIVALATRTDRQIPAVVLAVGSLLMLLSLRWPLVSLFALVVAIPLEQALVINDSLGTLSRYVALVFVVSYAAPRLGSCAPSSCRCPLGVT